MTYNKMCLKPNECYRNQLRIHYIYSVMTQNNYFNPSTFRHHLSDGPRFIFVKITMIQTNHVLYYFLEAIGKCLTVLAISLSDC